MTMFMTYKGKMFEVVEEGRNAQGVATFTGYRLQGKSGVRVGKAITVPASEVQETGNALLITTIKAMSESALLDFVLEHPDYFTDPYYIDLAEAVHARHAMLRGKDSATTS